MSEAALASERPFGWPQRLICLYGIIWREGLRFLHQRERFISALVRQSSLNHKGQRVGPWHVFVGDTFGQIFRDSQTSCSFLSCSAGQGQPSTQKLGFDAQSLNTQQH